jgi:hypothetical protein
MREGGKRDFRRQARTSDYARRGKRDLVFNWLFYPFRHTYIGVLATSQAVKVRTSRVLTNNISKLQCKMHSPVGLSFVKP